MSDAVAVISVVALSTVALAAVAAQLWQGRQTIASERRAWLRDRRAEGVHLAVATVREDTRPGIAG